MNIEGNIAIICITENGKKLALKINSLVNNCVIYQVKNKKSNLVVEETCVHTVQKKLSDFVGEIFSKFDYIVFIMATGIVVRSIAPYIISKFSDPAILVMDEKGKNVISLLSGHIGGANSLTQYISSLIDANPVITTATDINQKASLDMIAKKLNAHIEEMISNINVVKSFNYERKSVNDFKEVNDRLLNISLKSQIYTSLLMPIMNVISNIGFATICIIGGILASKDIITIGVIASFLSYVRQFTRPLNELANLFNTLLSAIAGCERVFEIIDEQEEQEVHNMFKSEINDNKDGNLNSHFVKGEIELKDVSFSYDSKKKILDNINLKIKSGTSNAIIGETGSGKTTIINLITNFYHIDEGSIFLDGADPA